jgi:hypothetical protein
MSRFLEELERRDMPSAYVPAAAAESGAVLQPGGILQLVPQDSHPVYYKINPAPGGQIEVDYRDDLGYHESLWNQSQITGIIYYSNGVQTNYCNETSVNDVGVWVASGSVAHGGTGAISVLGLLDGLPTERVPSGNGILVGRARFNELSFGPGSGQAGIGNPNGTYVLHTNTQDVFEGFTSARVSQSFRASVYESDVSQSAALRDYVDSHYWSSFKSQPRSLYGQAA